MKRVLLVTLALAAVLFALAMVGGRGNHPLRDKRPVCTSAISSIRVVGDHTERGPVVWFPKGCRHG